MGDTEEKIVEAAIRTFVRFGARKTAMADIAEAAGVSRQTLYATFGGKDELIVASIRTVTERSLAEVRDGLKGCSTLSERLDVYLGGTVVKSFELLQSSGDAEDLISGHNQAGRSEIARSHERHEVLLAEILAPNADRIDASGHSVQQLAHFIVTVGMGFKHGAANREDLDGLCRTLKNAVLAIAK